MPSAKDEKERRRLFTTSKRLLKDIDGLIAQMRGRSKADSELLAALRRTNEERIALERDLWILEDRILRDILSCPAAHPETPTIASLAPAYLAPTHALTTALFSMRHASRRSSSPG